MPSDNTPTIDQFRPVVLRVPSDDRERRIPEIGDDLASDMALSENILQETVPSGRS